MFKRERNPKLRAYVTKPNGAIEQVVDGDPGIGPSGDLYFVGEHGEIVEAYAAGAWTHMVRVEEG